MKNSRAFTLIELLVVVLIIGILAAVAVPQYQVAVWKSRMTHAMVWAKSIRDAEQIYYLANGKYTPSLEELDVELPGNCTQDTSQDPDNTETIAAYQCDNSWKVIIDVVYGVYVGVPANYLPANTRMGIQYYFHNDTRLCQADIQHARVCRALGATGEPRNYEYYNLP